MNELIGQSLGPYQILEQLGQGGMATVFKAFHPAMDRYVAVKVLPRHMATDPQFRARFQREARTIAKLEHRYILPVHDTGEQDGIHYMVMRYTEGGTLSDLIAQGQLSVERVALLVAQVAEALGYAHRQGVVHRDIKPANILISREGDALLSDFGIARIVEGTMQLTGDGMLIGTPYYMAPEQVQGQPSDARTDIYALGVVLYEALAGKRPYEAETPLAVALMHVHNALPPPRQLRPDLPEALERVILRAMAKNPADRFQHADEMAAVLRSGNLASQPGTAALPVAATMLLPAEGTTIGQQAIPPIVAKPPKQRASWVLPVIIGALVLLVLGGLLVRARFGIADRPPRETPGGATTIAIEPTSEAPLAAGEAPAASEPQPTSELPAEAIGSGTLAFFSNTANHTSIALIDNQIWAATPGGLVRWTVNDNQIYTAADGLPFTAVRTLQAEPDGTLWLSGEKGVARLHPNGDQLGEITLYASEGELPISYVSTFLRLSDGPILAGGYLGSGLVRWDGSSWNAYGPALTTEALDGMDGEITTLTQDKDGVLYVGVTSGLLRITGDSVERYTEAQGIGELQINHVLADTENRVWVAAGDTGLLRLNTDANRWEHVDSLKESPILRIFQLSDGRLAAMSFDHIAESADGGATWRNIDADTNDFGYQPQAVLETPDGTIVIGSSEGLAGFSNGKWDLLRPENQLPDNSIGLLQFHDNQLYIVARYGDRFAVLDPSDATITLMEDEDGRGLAFSSDSMWYGNSAGLFRKQGDTVTQFSADEGLPDTEVYSLLATESTLWIGTRSGLTSLDLATGKLNNPVPEFAGAVIETLYAAPDGSIWAGSTDEGDAARPIILGRFADGAWQIWKRGETPFLANASGISAITADTNGAIWVAAWGAGLWQWDGSAWKQVPTKQGPQGAILGFALHDAHVWAVGQFDALYAWDGTNWKRVEIDGLPSQVNSILFGEGTIWFGTNEGLVRYR